MMTSSLLWKVPDDVRVELENAAKFSEGAELQNHVFSESLKYSQLIGSFSA